MPLIVTSAGPGGFRTTSRDYVDGEVIDVTDVQQPGLPGTAGRPPVD
jgi:hypothetical protein